MGKGKKSAQLLNYHRTRGANLRAGMTDETMPRMHPTIPFRSNARVIEADDLLRALEEESDIARLRNKYFSFETHCQALESRRGYLDSMGLRREEVYYGLVKKERQQ